MRYLFIFLLVPLFAFAQKKGEVILLEQTKDYAVVQIRVGEIIQQMVTTPNGEAKKIMLADGVQLLEKGSPDLPVLSFSLIVPNTKDARLELLSSDYYELDHMHIAPSKGKIYRNQNPAEIPYTYGAAYAQDAFYPQRIGQMNKAYILRDFRGQTTHVYPVQFNPVSKKLRVYTRLTFKIYFDQEARENVLRSNERFPLSINSLFNEIYKYQFLNYKTLSAPYTPLEQVGTMLILCPSKYATAMTDFIKWKEQKGFKVFFEMPDTMAGGANEAKLMQRITEYYLAENITYLLLVGDNGDITARNAFFSNPDLFGPSDIAYAYQNGNDHYPEFIVGRISADSIQDVVTQVIKTLQYERNPYTNTNWMRTQVGMASDQGPGDKGQYDQIHIREIEDSNKNYYTYNTNYEFYDGSQGGLDAPGNPTSTMLTNAINAGIGLMNYCGHGSATNFTTSFFSSTSDIPNLTNTQGDWPFIFSTACLQGNFVYSTCLGESFLRSRDANDNPTGAIAALMSSINQSWDPPMSGQDEINAILRHERPTYQTSFGALATSGFMHTMDNYNSTLDPHGGDEIADTWIIFADPSVVLYTKDEGQLLCTHSSTIGLYSASYKVQCPQNDALIGLYYQGKYLASATVVNGEANFTFSALSNIDTVFITATKQNFKPYFGYAVVDTGNPFGVIDLEKENIYIFPNPTNYRLNIKDEENMVKSLKIYSIHGQLQLESKTKSVDVSVLSPGTYEIILELEGRTIKKIFSKK